MKTYISLLRGINVSGHKKIKMADLRAHYEGLGFQAVKSYIQSGNLAFQTKEKAPLKIAARIKEMIQKEYGFEVSVLVFDNNYLVNAIEKNPYVKGDEENIKPYYLTFLATTPAPELVEAIADFQHNNDLFQIIDTNIYVYSPDGYSRTKLTNQFFERKLKVAATTRNWRSVLKLREMIND